MPRFPVALAVAATMSVASSWIAPQPTNPASLRTMRSQSVLSMAIDYNDPIVAEEFAQVQPLTYEDVEEELLSDGIKAPPSMNEMEVRLMLVEMRLRKAGKLSNGEKKKKPAKFSSKFEEALWTKPAFEEYYKSLKDKGDHNAQNVAAEYVNDPVLAEERYGKDYRKTLREVKAALTAPPPVKTPTLSFSGFPANMGEAACKMTLEAVGPVSEFECEESDEFPILKGKVTFEDIESAKKAMEQYNGMDMGMGQAIELVSV